MAVSMFTCTQYCDEAVNVHSTSRILPLSEYTRGVASWRHEARLPSEGTHTEVTHSDYNHVIWVSYSRVNMLRFVLVSITLRYKHVV